MEFLKRAKEEVRNLSVDIMVELQAKQKRYSRVFGLSCSATTMLGLMNTAFAASAAQADIASFGTEIQKVIANIYNATFPIVTVLAALMLVIAFIMRMTGSQQTAQKATSWIVRILICYVLINCIGLIFKVIENTTSGYKFNTP